MEINKNDLSHLVRAEILNESQSYSLWQWLQQKNQHKADFSFTNILYYFGGLITIGAMTLFMTLGWESFGGKGILFISLAYMALGLSLTYYFLYQKEFSDTCWYHWCFYRSPHLPGGLWLAKYARVLDRWLLLS